MLATLPGFLAEPWWMELFSHFRGIYLALGLLGLPLLARWPDRIGGILLSLTVSLNAALVLPLYWGRETAGAEAGRVVECNLLSSNPHPERALQFLRECQADVLVLLEVTPEWMERLQDLMGSYEGRLVQPRSDNFGIVLLSRTPLTQVQVVDLGGLPALTALTELGGRSVRIWGVHTLPPVGERPAQIRNHQLELVAAFQSQESAVILGDLNDTPWSPSLSQVRFHNARRGFGVLASWPAQLPLRIPIDHCYLKGDLVARDCRLGPDTGSDHLPLIVDLSFRP